MEQEDQRWKQRVKRTWYKFGDRNTKYFHTCANQRRKKNLIISNFTNSHQLCVKEEEIEEAFGTYFANIYTSTKPKNRDIDWCVQFIKPRVSKELNYKLNMDYTKKEVEDALK